MKWAILIISIWISVVMLRYGITDARNEMVRKLDRAKYVDFPAVCIEAMRFNRVVQFGKMYLLMDIEPADTKRRNEYM